MLDSKSALIIFIFLAVAGVVIYHESSEWDQFAKDHQCKVIGKMKGGMTTGIAVTGSGSVGTVIGSESDKTGYLCNDGVTYWR